MPRSVAINVGANTNEPGVRGPILPDGAFEYVPIPEMAPTAAPVPTYADLPISVDLPAGTRERPVHLDPEFAGYGPCRRYTYGDPYDVKARPLLDLEAGDHVFFYATLDSMGDGGVAWRSEAWGAYLIGRFELDRAPVPGEAYPALPAAERARFATNAHLKRAEFDAAVLLVGDPDRSALYETAIPLSGEVGTDPNRLVTALSTDSGRGPWWRRPLRFGASATSALVDLETATEAEVLAATATD